MRQQPIKTAQGGCGGTGEQPGKQHQGQTRQVKEQPRDGCGGDDFVGDQKAAVWREQSAAGFQYEALVVRWKFAEDQRGYDQIKRCRRKAVADQGRIHKFQGHAFFQVRRFDFFLGLGQHARRGVDAGDRSAALRHQPGKRARAAANLQNTRAFMGIAALRFFP